ncbi:MAG: hypothetical protein ACTSXD_05695 [Candidatus Heimdallarchaeaceae archaeon]
MSIRNNDTDITVNTCVEKTQRAEKQITELIEREKICKSFNTIETELANIEKILESLPVNNLFPATMRGVVSIMAYYMSMYPQGE